MLEEIIRMTKLGYKVSFTDNGYGNFVVTVSKGKLQSKSHLLVLDTLISYTDSGGVIKYTIQDLEKQINTDV